MSTDLDRLLGHHWGICTGVDVSDGEAGDVRAL